MQGGPRQSSSGPTMLRDSQRLPAPPAAAAALPSAVFCCLPTGGRAGSTGAPPGQTHGAVAG